MIPVERVVWEPALGVGFWDGVTATTVTEGLVVTTRPRHATEMPIRAAANPHGIHVLHRLPGLAAAAMPFPDDVSSGVVARQFAFDVVDQLARFHPFSFAAECPASGLYLPPCLQASPPEGRYVPVFSAPTRQAPAGMAVVRVELLDSRDRRPAAWAMLAVEHEGRELARSFADLAGRALLIFPYPEPPLASPPAGSAWRWTIGLRAAYSPAADTPAIPALCDLLAQRLARLWLDASPASELSLLELEYGRELVVRSGPSPGLLVEPA